LRIAAILPINPSASAIASQQCDQHFSRLQWSLLPHLPNSVVAFTTEPSDMGWIAVHRVRCGRLEVRGFPPQTYLTDSFTYNAYTSGMKAHWHSVDSLPLQLCHHDVDWCPPSTSHPPVQIVWRRSGTLVPIAD